MPEAPELTQELAARAKLQLRKRARALRAAHPGAALAERSERIVTRLLGLAELRSAGSLALFWPLSERKEVDLRRLDQAARDAGKRVYYPGLRRMEGGVVRTELRLTGSSADLAVRGSPFAEPGEDAPVAERGDVDLLVVPALAAAETGHRLGYGSGFYDATLPDFRPPAKAVVVAYDFELLAELPALAHDVACDIVVTDARVIVVAGPGA